ncbi:MAG: AAA family ATPase [Candidatus Micrarchaeales archaeon]|nr:AAA family ATPase [Candidatus Micrarchaeales archaeon]
MEEARPKAGDDSENSSLAAGGGGGGGATVSKEIIRRRFKRTPISVYHLKDKLMDMSSAESFLDALLIALAFIAVNWAFGFYPVWIIFLLLVVLFFATLFQPFLGLLVYTLFIYPIFIYQAPVLAWAFLIPATGMLLYGFKYYRVIAFTYLLTALAFSVLGFIFMIPAFIFAILTIGNKRAVVTLLLTMVIVVVLSGITGMQNVGYIVYNGQQAHAVLASNQNNFQVLALDQAGKPALNTSTFGAGLLYTFSAFFSSQVTTLVPSIFGIIVQALAAYPVGYVLQTIVLFAAIIGIDFMAVSSRSKFKGSYASAVGVLFPISFVMLGAQVGIIGVNYMTPFLSFAIAPALLYMFEYSGINPVQALEVKKQDIRMKFGEAFENLSSGNVSETFDKIGNYDATKKQLKDAIIAPIEERGISRAYNVRPTKGVLLFGPPGTGKTMMMRALATEIHAGFYYVKSTDLISAFPGESERMISNIFSIAKKNAPCVLFFDEIDSIALTREGEGAVDDTHRHALSQLLIEMDGFQKINNVIIVGATNRPDIIDAAILRPGRFDKIIYMPLPDLEGRKKIFSMYLHDLPISDRVDVDDIAKRAERYSGADIKSATETVAQLVAQEAVSEHKVLEITQQDILDVIKQTKASTSLAQLEAYKKFEMDFQRSIGKEQREEAEEGAVTINDVIGLESAKKAVREAIELPLMHPELMKKYDVKAINGLLMFGPPGNGKTMLMRAVSNEMKGVAMMELSGSELAEAGIERATATIKEIFNRAKENVPAIIFIDEIDGVLPKREGASEIAVQITSEMLQEIDGIKSATNIVVIGATNRPDMLDPAILRPGRFDKLIYVKPPTSANRAEMFRMYLKNVPAADDIDFAKLGASTKGFTGADIASVCREAKTAALEQELDTGAPGKVTMEVLNGLVADAKPSAPESVLAQYQEFLEKYGQR